MNRVTKLLSRIGIGKKDATVTLRASSRSEISIMNGFFGFSYGGGSFGKYVEAFGRNPLVYMIISKISVKESSLPRIVVDSNGDIVENSQIADILRKPNSTQFELDFRETVGQSLLATGNCFVWSREIVGMGFDLIVLQTENVDINVDAQGIVTSYTYRLNDNETNIAPDDMLHIKMSNIVNTKETQLYYGLSPLEAAFKVVQSSEEIFEAEAAIFKNRGIIGILTNETDVPLLSKDRNALQDNLNNEIGGAEKFNRVHLSNSKLKYLQMGMSPTDLKLIDGILNKLRILASVYGLNSILFNDQTASTFDNVAEANRSAHIDVYIPLGKKIDQNLSAFLSNKLGVDERIIIDENKIDVLKQINKDLSDAVVEQARELIITREEARDTLGYKPEEN
jgi:HK97 family phage portal protein